MRRNHSTRTRTNPAAKQARAEIVITPELLPSLLVRCRECGKFGVWAVTAVRGCSVCDFHTSRCASCGGEQAAERGVYAHVRWFGANGEAIDKFGSHHVAAWKAYTEERERRKHLRLVSGGLKHAA